MSKRRVTFMALSTLATAGGLIPATLAHAAGNSFYVGGMNCSDSAVGAGSSTTPFCSFAPALAAAGPGDTILVQNLPSAVVNGQYKSAEMDVTKSGTTGSPITIKAAAGLYGTTHFYPATHMAVVTGQHDIVIEGFTTFTSAAAYVVDGGSTGVTITGNDIQGGGVALSGGATGDTVSANRIVQSANGGVTLTDAPGNSVVGNTLQGNNGYQIAVTGASSGTTIANNISVDAQMPIGSIARPDEIQVAATATSGTTVHHNIVFPAQQAFLNPDTGQTYPAGLPYSWGGTGYPDVASFAAATGQGAHDLMVDPQFGGAGLLPTSPAIDSADASVPGEASADLHGDPRVDDPKVTDTGAGPQTFHDRGAIEYQGAPIPVYKYAITGTPTSETVTVDASATVPGFTPVASYTFDFGGVTTTQTGAVFAKTFAVVDDPATAKPFQDLGVGATGQDGRVGDVVFGQGYTLGPVYQPIAKLTTALDPGVAGGVVADPTASTPAQPSTIATTPGTWSDSLITTYVVDWGDGSSPDYPGPLVAPVKHAYAKAGTYTVKLTVITGMNISNSTTSQVTVATGSGVTPPPPPGGGTTNPPPGGGTTNPPPSGGSTNPPPSGGTTNPPPSGGTAAQPGVHRIGGDTRYLTALKVSGEQWKDGTANGVVIARGDAAPDALAGVPLAAHVHGPLLLTDPQSLDAATAAEVKRVLGANPAKDVYILGGTSAVSPGVESQLTALGYRVHRLGGATRYETALKIATDGLGTTSNVVVATGADFADALAAGPLAASQNAAIVLSDGTTLDPATAAFVRAHSGVTAVGGSAKTAVQSAVSGKPVNLLWGQDRYETATKVAEAMAQNGHAPTGVGIAGGTAFPDALTGGAYAANAGIPLLLTDPKQLPDEVATLLTGWRAQLTGIEVFGGPVAVGDSVLGRVLTVVNGRAV